MKPRLLILVVLAVGVAVFWAWKRSAPAANGAGVLAPDITDEQIADSSGMTSEEIKKKREEQTLLPNRPLNCERAPDKPTVNVRLEVDTSAGKSRMWLYLTEANGWYAQHFAIDIWYTGGDDSVTPEESKHAFEIRKDEYIRAKDTLKTCIELNPAEIARVGGSIGSSSDWKAEVTYTDRRACLKDPDPLPILSESTCK